MLNISRIGAGIFMLNDFLSHEECSALIAQSERTGYAEAPIRTLEGEQMFKGTRNNDRIVFDDPELARTFFERALPYLPADIDGWAACGLNERFRFYRYAGQQYFKWHKDDAFRRSDNEESFLTFMVYLNDGYAGGSTDFGWECVTPKAGAALVFPHRLRHQGATVTSGVKYVLRTDVMYRCGEA